MSILSFFHPSGASLPVAFDGCPAPWAPPLWTKEASGHNSFRASNDSKDPNTSKKHMISGILPHQLPHPTSKPPSMASPFCTSLFSKAHQPAPPVGIEHLAQASEGSLPPAMMRRKANSSSERGGEFAVQKVKRHRY